VARKLVAEAIGTFALVFAGPGAIVIDAETGALGHVGVGISFGLVIMAMIYATGHVSGAHFNPAVTLAFAVTRHLPWPLAGGYWGAQSQWLYVLGPALGAVLGALAYQLIRGEATA
jgi:aquaporin NIP